MESINEIQFGILSKEDILNMSVCEVNNNRIVDIGTPNTVYDSRMGPARPGEDCPTCNQKFEKCPGHFGHIVLNTEIMHPLYYKFALNILRVFCIDCSRLLATKEHLELWNLLKYKSYNRLKHLTAKLLKKNLCCHCNSVQPRYTFSPTESCFYTIFKTDDGNVKLPLHTDQIKNIFENILNEDLELCGLNPKYMHPNSFVLSVIPVIPPQARPFIVASNMVCDDDLTLQYTEILKINKHLENNDLGDTKRKKYIQTLVFRVKTLMDNSQGKAKHTNSRQIKGIKERLTGKDGLIRGHLLGKRTNFSARTVIGPDPTLCTGEVAVPPQVSEILAIPEYVNSINIENMKELLRLGKINHVNRGEMRFNMKYAKNFDIKVGDLVERQLRDGDFVIINRQPTLHKTSMLAKKVVIRQGKTIRLNLATCAQFNAD